LVQLGDERRIYAIMLNTEKHRLTLNGKRDCVADAELVLRTNLEWVLYRTDRDLGRICDSGRQLRVQRNIVTISGRGSWIKSSCVAAVYVRKIERFSARQGKRR